MFTIPNVVLDELNTPFQLTTDQIDFFRENGFIKIKSVLSPETIEVMDTIISAEVDRLNKQHLEMKDRDTYGKAFLQIMNIWRNSDLVKQIVFSKRLAKIAADLLEVEGVRLYHDQALYKEPGGGHTPWHADQRQARCQRRSHDHHASLAPNLFGGGTRRFDRGPHRSGRFC